MTDTGVAPSRKAKAVLEEATNDRVVLTFPNTNYRLHLKVLKVPSTPVGKRIHGTIRVGARRIDNVRTGGAYIEPVYGEPRRVQGEVLAIDTADQTITINAGPCPVVVKVNHLQKAEQFKPGDFISFDALSGASFLPV